MRSKKSRNAEKIITQNERHILFEKAHSAFGEEKGNSIIKQLVEAEGLQSTSKMTKSMYERVIGKLDNMISESK